MKEFIITALTKSIQPRLNAYKRAYRMRKTERCLDCEKLFNPRTMVAAQKPELVPMAEFFLEHTQLPVPISFTSACKFKKVDSGFEAIWRNYHTQIASLKLVCRDCSLKNSKKT